MNQSTIASPVIFSGFPKSIRNPTRGPESRLVGKVLVAGNAGVCRNSAIRLLERIGFEVRLAAEGPQVVSLLDSDVSAYVLVIFDCNLYGTNAVQVLREIRIRSANMPVILMNRFRYTHVMKGQDKAGHSAFLSKPFTFDTLSSALRAALGQQAPVLPGMS